MNDWFLKPKNAYRGIPFWSWNCKVTKEQIDKDLDCFEQMGFGGVDIHPRVGLDNEYLGDEFMELVLYTVEQCKKRGLICWLYDDDRYPSGAADGIVTQKMQYRDRGLLLTVDLQPLADEENEDGYCVDRNAFEEACNQGKKPLGYFVGAYALRFEDGILQEYQYLTQAQQIKTAQQNKMKIRYAYVKLAKESPSFEGQTYIDTLNSDAVKEFIRVTHERYEQTVGKEFGNTVEAIFTDEPRIGKQGMIASANSNEPFEIPYSESFEAYWKQHCKTFNLLECVPELIWDLPDGRHRKKRYLYRDALTECFTQNYMDQICTWCRENHIFMTGHVLAETPLTDQTVTVGECMRSYRNMDIPGFDVLCDDECFVAAKQSVSVSRQMGRLGTVSELYGVTGWDCSFETYKRQGDWQAALGVTRRVPHLSFMSMGGEAKRDWPASISHQSPWYREFPYIEDHFARLNAALSQGKVLTKTAVVHPIESVWLHMGQADKNRQAAEKIEESFEQITRMLLFDTIDLDYLSESLLPEQRVKAEKGVLKVGQACYQTVIVPSMETIRSTTLAILEAFHKAGGRVVFAGEIPTFVDAEKSDRANMLAKQCEIVKMDSLLDALKSEKDLIVTDHNDQPSNDLFCQQREDEQGRWIFLCNAKKQPRSEEIYTIRVKGRFHAKKYETQTGEITEMMCLCTQEETNIFWHSYGQDSLLLRLEPIREQQILLTQPDAVTLEEDNALVLDYAQAVLDQTIQFDCNEILKLDDQIRLALGYERRNEHMRQPWATQPGKSHELTLKYEFESEISTDAKLALELSDGCEVFLNGIAADRKPQGYYVDPAISLIQLPKVQKGKNELIIKLMYHQKTNLEAMYLLGKFGVSLSGKKTAIIPMHPLALGDITKQGLPFYTGNIRYEFAVDIQKTGIYSVWIPKWNAPFLTVFVDGRKVGAIAYKPYKCTLGKLEEGKHVISVCLFGNRNNGFGALHNSNSHIRWNGPTAYRTQGTDWTDEYRVKPVGVDEMWLISED